MANAIDNGTKLHILDTSDIVYPDRSICVRMVQMTATAKADAAQFYTLVAGTTADHDNYFSNLTITNTYTITDAATGDKWTGIAANDWVHITECSIAANNGWWYLQTDNGNSTFDIDHTSVIKGTTHALTNGTTMSARIRTYTPVECMAIVADSAQAAAASIHHPVLDFGDKGRWFHNLSFVTANTLEIHLYER